MSKISEYDLSDLPQEPIDMLEDVRNLLNFGKYQASVVSAVPNWVGRRGEFVWYMANTTGFLYVCSSDGTSNHWNAVLGWTIT